MIFLRRWKAILAWAGCSALFAKGGIWFANLNPPYTPEWCAIFFLLIGALCGAVYCTATEEIS